jgi:isopropylmalate/homocitrate/citramalate synthase
MLNYIYPKCANSFRHWYTSHPKWELFYNYLGKPKPFDVTLRDGLQGLSIPEQNNFTLERKKELYHTIIRDHNPEYMEIGSIVSEKLLPIFKDSIDFHKYVEKQQRMENKKVPIEFFVLVPNQRQFEKIVNNYLIHNL